MQPDITLCHLGFPFKAGGTSRYVPVGMLYLVAGLEAAGFKVDFRDCQACPGREPLPSEAVCAFLDGHAQIVGIGCMARELPLAVMVARQLKEARPETFVVLGGTGPSAVAAILLQAFPWIDGIVRGEADCTLVELLGHLKEGEPLDDVRGISWRQGEQVFETGDRPLVEDLDALPMPAYASVDLSGYDTVYLSGSRGCPFRCTFCDQPAFWHGCARERSAPSVFRELETLAGLKEAWNITFADNIFCSTPRALEEFYREYQAGPLRFCFGVNQRVGLVTPEALSMLRHMNTNLVLLGIESGSARILQRIRKPFVPRQAREAIRLCSDTIPLTVASFIYDYPFETLADFVETLDLIWSVLRHPVRHVVVIQLHHLSPLAGTPIFEEYGASLCASNAATLMTSTDNLQEYRTTSLEGGRFLVTPMAAPAEERAASPTAELVRLWPAIFPSHYLYRSPQQEAKEQVLSAFVDMLASSRTSFALALEEATVVCDDRGIHVA